MAWVVLQPALLLSVYVFVYMVVLPDAGSQGSAASTTCSTCSAGWCRISGFMEALTTGALSIKQNIHLVKNVMLPIELIPVRSVIVGMASQFVSIGLVLLLAAADRSLSWHVALAADRRRPAGDVARRPRRGCSRASPSRCPTSPTS